jgi:hypothetical protein
MMKNCQLFLIYIMMSTATLQSLIQLVYGETKMKIALWGKLKQIA